MITPISVLSGTGFSLWILVLARSNPHRLKPVSLNLMRLRIQARVLMQQAFSLFRRHRNALQFLARAAKLRDPLFPLRTKLPFEFLAQALRERGTQAASGNCNLQFAAAHHSGEVEIA